MSPHPAATVPSGGFSLIEALVAMVVIAVGLLGLAAMITAGLRANQVANLQSLAAIDAGNIAALMSANPAGVAAGNYVMTSLPTTPPGNLCQSASTPCSPAEEAQADLWGFAQNLASNLPAPTAEIQCAVACSSTTDAPMVITITWTSQSPDGRAMATANYSTVYQP
jgi:type IV pilus assembly protein PilV